MNTLPNTPDAADGSDVHRRLLADSQRNHAYELLRSNKLEHLESMLGHIPQDVWFDELCFVHYERHPETVKLLFDRLPGAVEHVFRHVDKTRFESTFDFAAAFMARREAMRVLNELGSVPPSQHHQESSNERR